VERPGVGERLLVEVAEHGLVEAFVLVWVVGLYGIPVIASVPTSPTCATSWPLCLTVTG
jgi:hypothetical protein